MISRKYFLGMLAILMIVISGMAFAESTQTFAIMVMPKYLQLLRLRSGMICPSDITIAVIWLKTKSIIVFGGKQHKRLMVQPTFTLPLFHNT